MKIGTRDRALVLAVEGKAGHERQAMAVAERLFPTDVIRLPRHRRAPAPLELSRIALVVAAGRQAIAPARAILAMRPRPVVAVLQPVLWRSHMFDLIWSPRHDRRRAHPPAAENRMETLTTPSPLRAADLEAALHRHSDLLRQCPAPRVGVLVGGPSHTHRFGALEADELAARLAAFCATHQTSLLVATSPRTTPAITAKLEERLNGLPHAILDYRRVADPSCAYAAVLGAASSLIVTSDSMAMMSEAVATGKPLYAWRLPGGKAKYESFYRSLEWHGALRWFDGGHDLWTYEPLDAAGAIAERLRPLLGVAERR